jgi:hypothetical protein
MEVLCEEERGVEAREPDPDSRGNDQKLWKEKAGEPEEVLAS